MLAYVLVAALCANEAGGDESLEAFFSAFAESRNAIERLDARFVQTTITPDESIMSEGSITYARPKRLIFRYDDPPIVYMIDALNAYEFDPELEQVQIFQLEDRPESEAYYLGFENNADQLQDAYTVRILPAEDSDSDARALEITPKENDEEAFFEKVTLQLRDDDYLPIAIRIDNDAESHVQFTVTDFRVNEPADTETTHINLPEGTVIVQNDVYEGTVGPDGLQLPRASDALVEAEPLDAEPSAP